MNTLTILLILSKQTPYEYSTDAMSRTEMGVRITLPIANLAKVPLLTVQ